MDPPPDHGENSYRGSGPLAGRKALITGGDSGMGRAAAIAFAREGADVAINYLPPEEPDAQEVAHRRPAWCRTLLIQAAGRKAVLLPGDIRSQGPDQAARRQRHPRQRRGAGPGVDAASSNRRPD